MEGVGEGIGNRLIRVGRALLLVGVHLNSCRTGPLLLALTEEHLADVLKRRAFHPSLSPHQSAQLVERMHPLWRVGLSPKADEFRERMYDIFSARR